MRFISDTKFNWFTFFHWIGLRRFNQVNRKICFLLDFLLRICFSHRANTLFHMKQNLIISFWT